MNNNPTTTTTITPAALGFDEPWQVRPHDLENGPVTCSNGIQFQNWDIIGNSGPRCLCETGWSDRPVAWGPAPDPVRAAAIRDRIVACVNACAGMANPIIDIPALRTRITELEAEVALLNRIIKAAQCLIDEFDTITPTPTP